jgi:DNA-binding beta-propeller fold protein YncE
VLLVDVFTGETLLELQTHRTARSLALTTNGDRLLIASPSAIESISLSDRADRQENAVPGADAIVVARGGGRVYSARTRPTGVSALPLPLMPKVDWTTRVPSRVRALAADESSGVLLVGHNWDGGTVEVVDEMSGVIRRSTATESAPMAFAFTHDGRTAYALLRNGTLTPIGVGDELRGAATRIARRPRALAIAPDDRVFYVLDSSHSSVAVVDRDTVTIRQAIGLPAKPYDMALSPDGSRLLVTSPPARSIFVIDTSNLVVVETLHFRRPPRRVVFASRRSQTPQRTPPITAGTSPSATKTGLAVSSHTATKTPLDGAGFTPTPTPTASPASPQAGVAVGAVFDDGSAQPLPDVQLQPRSAGTSIRTDTAGRYVVAQQPAVIELTKDGYTRAVRQLSAPNTTAVTHVLDARLTRLASPATIGTTGGAVGVNYTAPDATSIAVALSIAPTALEAPLDIQLTILTPQALIAPLPLGWSVLLGVDVRTTEPAVVPATLRIPLALLGAAASLPMSVAVWDDDAALWRAAAPATVRADGLEVAVSSLPTQLALIIADAIPTAPPPLRVGAPIEGVPALQRLGESALVITDPDVVIAGGDTRTHVQTQVRAVAPLPSGTRLLVELRELYELRDGRQIAGTASRQDLIGYQLDTRAPQAGNPSEMLSASFTLRPSRAFDIGALTQGRITIDTILPQADELLDAVDNAGGDVSGLSGLRIRIPAGATQQTTAIALRPAAASDLPAGITLRTDLVGALRLDVTGGTLNPVAPYAIDLGVVRADGQRFALARAATVDLQSVLVLVAFGHSESGCVVMDACPSELTFCLPGIEGSGTYAVFLLPTGVSLVTGTVGDGSGVGPGLTVSSDTAAVVGLTNSAGQFALPLPPGVSSTIGSKDRQRDLVGTVTVAPTAASQVITADIELRPTVPEVIHVSPANHGSGIAADATITLQFSEPIAAASLTDASVRVARVAGASASPVTIHSSLSTDGTQLLLTPDAPLLSEALYRVTLTGTITDRSGTPLTPFESDFTTAPIFKADALPPNTLRVSLPDADGRVFVCGGTQLALPGTFFAIINDTSGTTFTGLATDRDGRSGSDVCDALFPGQCDTSQPGSFCAVVDADFGDAILVRVEDALRDTVTVDAGLMRDELTGTTVIGPAGGTVAAVADARYHLAIPPGAFDAVTLVTVTPARKDEFPATADATMEFIAGAHLDFGGHQPLRQVDLSVPAPADASSDDQYLATQVVSVRGIDELTAMDTAFLDAANNLITTDPAYFDGIRYQGLFGMVRTRECTAYVTGFVALSQQFNEAYLPGDLSLPALVLTTDPTRVTVPVPCNQPVQLELRSLTDDPIDFLSLSIAPRKGEFVFWEQTLSDDKIPPAVIGTQTSIPDAAQDVGHDAEVSIPFDKPILSSSIDGHAHVFCTIGGAEKEITGTWSQSADGKRLFFVQRDGQPLRGLPLSTHCTVRIEGLQDQHGNAMSAPFSMSFTTFQPTVAGRVPQVDAVAVDSIGWHRVEDSGDTAPLLKQFVAFAEGDAYRLDSQGGVLIQEVTEQTTTAAQFTQPTAGFDYALRFLRPENVTDAAGNQYSGPYLMSVDGAGGTESRRRLGVWHLFDLANFPSLRQVVSRAVNQSADSLELLNSLNPGEDPVTFDFLRQIPNDLGVPLAIAGFGANSAYIANAPFIGLELIQLQGIDPARQGVDGVLRGHFRSVAVLGTAVIGARPDGLVITDAGLRRNPVLPDYLVNGPQTSLLTLQAWPVDRNRNGQIGDDERFDLVVVVCQEGSRPALCIVAFDPAGNVFAPNLLEGKIVLPFDAQPFRAFADPERRLLYLANGTMGLTVIDFQDPSGSIDDSPQDGVDDRVLANIPLPADANRTAVARDVAMDINNRGRVNAYVAARADGWYKVDLGPARMDVHLEGVAPGQTFGASRIEVAEVRYFNEKDSTFYEPVVQLPGHIADLYPERVDVTITTLDAAGMPVVSPQGDFAPASVTLSLRRVRQTNRYALNPDGYPAQALLVSNLPMSEATLLTSSMQRSCQPQGCFVVYGGLGGKIRLEAAVLPGATSLAGRIREIPIEKVGVILIGIDGLRQEVLYPAGENDVQEPNVSDLLPLDVESTPGFGAIMGGAPQSDGHRDIGAHSLRLRGVSAIFPSITLASWASVLSGEGPNKTGELGNEFFDRSATNRPGVPEKRQAPPGMVSYSNGAFPGYDTFGVLEKRNWQFIPGNDPAPESSPQNQLWQGHNLFSDLKDERLFPGFREQFGPLVVAGNHYARGADLWLTSSFADLPYAFSTIGCGIETDVTADEGLNCARASDSIIRSRVLRYFDEHRSAWFAGREKFPSFLMLYQPGPDHLAHYRGLRNGEYRNYIRDEVGGNTLNALRAALIDIEQYYNKIFIITTDHGHTETGAAGEREDWTHTNWDNGGPPVDSTNRNMHIDEFIALTQLVGQSLAPRRMLEVLRPEMKETSLADLAVAFDGPMAHVYVRTTATNAEGTREDWAEEACQADRDTIANGVVAALGGLPAAFGISPNLNSEAAAFGTARPLRSLTAAIDFVLVRKGQSYVVRQPRYPQTATPTPTPTPTGTPTEASERAECNGLSVPNSSIEEFALEQFFGAENRSTYVHAIDRIKKLDHRARAGDIILVFRSRTDDLATARYTSSSNIPSWHGSLNRSDSYVPFIVSYPGGNADPLKTVVSSSLICSNVTTCDSTLRVAPLVEHILALQTGPE